MSKKRLDLLMVEKGLVSSRERARVLILSGEVSVNGATVRKAGDSFQEDAEIVLKKADCPYVSRGGLKLEKAINEFGIDLRGRICMDIGASTGGFTDCMLMNGAVKVYAVDVGYGQLAWKLRTDERVVVMERVNARYLTRDDIPDDPDFASIDVSFISLKLIIPALKGLGVKEVAALIKPQFEAGREKVGKKGIVREKETHMEVLRDITDSIFDMGYSVEGVTFSPIKGQDGNIEFLGHFVLSDEPVRLSDESILDIVSRAHEL